MMNLLPRAVIKYIVGLLGVGALIFLPAGGLDYKNGLLLMGLMFVPMLAVGIVMYVKAPGLLAKRLDTKEKEPLQNWVMAVMGLLFAAGFISAGIDWRFGLSKMPLWLTVAASAVFLLSYAAFFEVMRENAYLSRTVKVQEGQQVVSTGLYGIVRHPMYAAALGMFVSVPLILGSWWAFLFFFMYVPLIVIRITGEERVLSEGLDGYAEYKKRVRYRLVPFVW